MNILIDLFLTFMKIGALSIGGGYASLAYIQSIVVEEKGWLDMTSYVDLLTLSQMTPGPLAINSASFVGMKVAGPLGAIVATIGNVIPSLLIVLCLSMLYFKYKRLSGMQLVMSSIRPVVVALIASVVYGLVLNLANGQRAIIHIILLCICVLVLRWKKVNAMVMIIATGIINVVISLF
ncbi:MULTISPECIES: chromate transporter [unclassified Granulicatella]|uniref:chromate transporter n=1 Tax=unclassified Granulicatella TaxID=2630493 RepID=UPI0010745007|nr:MULTISPECIES: chromate transporter [unclassified Granulicatella]MBF0780348.1 chromate transporter [Granulicatella sp. 19428wC4_WM01]TFU95527.1 chromate transporter [Granulicatella sp. WM01]